MRHQERICNLLRGGRLAGRTTRTTALGDFTQTTLTSFLLAKGKKTSILGGITTRGSKLVLLQLGEAAFALQRQGGDQALDFRGLAVRLSVFLGDGSRYDVFADVIFFFQVEKFADPVGALGAKTAGLWFISQSWDGLLPLLDDEQVQDGDIWANNAATDTLAFAHTGAAILAEATCTGLKQKANTLLGKNTLLHWETLLVVTATDLEDVTFVLIAQVGAVDFGPHADVIECLELLFVVDLQVHLLRGGRVGNVKFHLVVLESVIWCAMNSRRR